MNKKTESISEKLFMISEKQSIDEKERSIVAWGSKPERDRDGELIKSSAWNLDNFRKNPVILLSHNYSTPPVAKALWTKVSNDGLLFKAQFANTKTGQELFELYKDGFMNSFSVGFIPNDYEEPDDEQKSKGINRVYTDVELLEISCVSVPSCPVALMERYHSGEIKTKDVSDAIKNILLLAREKDETEQKNGDVESNVSESISDELQTEEKGQSESGKKTEDVGLSIEGKEEDNSETKGENGKSETEEGLEECNCIECNPENGDEKAACRRKPKKSEEETKSVTCQCSSCDCEIESENGSCDMECPECGESMSAMGEEACNKPKKPKKDTEVVTKPETTDNYHRIPIDSNDHTGHKIRTISYSESQGIKALYCVTDKKVITMLFDVNKFTMDEAKQWVNNHKPKKSLGEFNFSIKARLEEPDNYKERWNKSLSKLWDVASAPSNPTDYESTLCCKFLGCSVKDIYKTTFEIPSPLMGSYFGAFKNLCNDFDYKDTRDIDIYGREISPSYETIQLNSKTHEDFLIRGLDFYEKDGDGIILRFYPTWWGQNVDIITSRGNKEFNKEFLVSVHKWVDENNYLKNEKFNLSGEFIESEEDQNWDSVILTHTNKRAMKLIEKLVNEKEDGFKSRGALMIGPPGSGKTLSGKTLLNRTDKTFIWIAASDFGLFHPWNAHKCIELTFSLARKLAPSIVFMEDVDNYLHSGENKLFDHLKTELDGIRKNKGVVTILTSNYPEKLPDALLDRPGRFHDVLLFDLPDKELRTEMISKWVGEDVGEDLMDILLESTDGYSGAHMRELVDLAKSISEDEEMDVVEALIESLEKLSNQRQLIASIREKREKSVDNNENETEWKITSGTINTDELEKSDCSSYVTYYSKNGKYFDKDGNEVQVSNTKDPKHILYVLEDGDSVPDSVFKGIEGLKDSGLIKTISPKEEFVKKSEMDSLLEGLKTIISPKLEEKKEEVVETKEIDVNSKEFVSTVKDCIVEILQGSKIDVKELLQEELKKANGEMY